MKQEDVRALSNHFQAVRLVSLHTWSAAAEIPDRDAHGPYMVVQGAYHPDDLTLTPDQFVLGRSGAWLQVGLFFQLPLPERRAEYLFATAAAVMEVMRDLPPKPVVLDANAAVRGQTDDTAAPPDDLRAAFEIGLAAPPRPSS
ncbi:MAG: hypothetical protein IT580_06530 [Verrucomicrobiales bacterium]|nr:hypothetical protein [Verrucomicrobiales bacterium]